MTTQKRKMEDALDEGIGHKRAKLNDLEEQVRYKTQKLDTID